MQALSALKRITYYVALKNISKTCGADQYVYVKRDRNNLVHVCLYADDMIIDAKTKVYILEVKLAIICLQY